jgi:hypothetical protein
MAGGYLKVLVSQPFVPKAAIRRAPQALRWECATKITLGVP